MRAIEFVGLKSDLDEGQRLDLVNCILPLVVERFKPRLCVDGGPHLGIGADEKLPCELDVLPTVMNNLQKDDYMIKCDDSNGFMHINLDDVAKPMHCFEFGNLIFRCTSLPFGLR